MKNTELSTVKKFLDSYYDINSDEELEENLKCIHSSKALHVLVSEINWDGASKEICYVIDHENCDFGTALLCYWYNQPGYWSGKNAQTIADYEKESFELHIKLQKRLLGGLYRKSEIKFDPHSDQGIDWVSSLRPKELETIPKELMVSSRGTPIDSIDWETIF